MTAITNKRRMYKLLMAGKLGNFAQVWGSLDEALSSGYTGIFSIRSLETSNPIRRYHVPYEELQATYDAIPADRKSAGMTFCQAPPDDKRTIQGELMRDVGGLYFFYSTLPLVMRDALDQDGKHARGLQAKMLLQHYLEPVDYDMLMDLLDEYPDHVIEFSAFTVPVGVMPHRRTIIWEIRKY